ncbi:YfjI family protein [Legionella feeleii]|uniref:5' DNA primase TraC n=1 Tax=Legionella feeleii TaxID=453 RepID=A0A0W0U1T0_9GAMM|nr:YfjI family protein [Legionella feeleii]KTD01972.1 hypothetical protein Lfee_0908 [Legionella feeleii]SPX62219.1 Uncharacterised protein [Legionella feeleii]
MNDFTTTLKKNVVTSTHEEIKNINLLDNNHTTTTNSCSVDSMNLQPRNEIYQILPESRPEVLQLSSEMLPDSIRDYIFDVAERQQSLPDFVAVTALIGLASLLGRKALICPKQHDDWSVTPNQWGAIIGRPSAMKSPSMKEALRPLYKLEDEANLQYKEEQKSYQEEGILLELESGTAKENAKKAFKYHGREAAREALRTRTLSNPPIRRRLTVNDPTVEKLGELLNENPNGLLLVRDELAGWLASLYREDHQSDRAFYLECFDGNGRYIYDRIGRGTIEIENCTLSIIGGIQPSRIATLIRSATHGIVDDGLIQRFQLAIWPNDLGRWQWIDRAPNLQAKIKYDKVFETLHHLGFKTEDNKPRQFRFTNDSQPLFIQWMNNIQELARNPETYPVLESHMLKMPQTIAGLALLFEIIDGGREAVGIEATKRALKWAEYLLSHAKRLYSIANNNSLDAAKIILKRKKQLPNTFSTRDIQRKGWSGLDSSEIVHEALTWLIDYGYCYIENIDYTDTNGRPKTVFHWNEKKEIPHSEN